MLSANCRACSTRCACCAYTLTNASHSWLGPRPHVLDTLPGRGYFGREFGRDLDPRPARRANSGFAGSIESDRRHPKADGTCGMVQHKFVDRDGLVPDESQCSLQRFSFGKQSMDDCHSGQAHSGGRADRGQRGADLGRLSNHSPLVAEKR